MLEMVLALVLHTLCMPHVLAAITAAQERGPLLAIALWAWLGEVAKVTSSTFIVTAAAVTRAFTFAGAEAARTLGAVAERLPDAADYVMAFKYAMAWLCFAFVVMVLIAIPFVIASYVKAIVWTVAECVVKTALWPFRCVIDTLRWMVFAKRVKVIVSVVESSAEVKTGVSLEMANVAAPLGTLNSRPGGLLNVVTAEGVHLGFATYVDAGYDVVILTAKHVLDAATAADGKIRLVGKGGRAHPPFVPFVRRELPKLDQVHIIAPDHLGATTGAKIMQSADYNNTVAVRLYAMDVSGEVATSFSRAEVVKPLEICYAASTLPGSSGSPILQNGKVVGVHHSGGAPNGVVKNLGSVLVRWDPRAFIKESPNLNQHAGYYVLGPDFPVDEGWETVEDFLNEPAGNRGSKLYLHGRSAAAIRFSTQASEDYVPKAMAFQSRTGANWADLETAEQGNGRAEPKTGSLPPAHPATSSDLTGSATIRPKETSAQKKRRRKLAKSQASTGQEPTPGSGPTTSQETMQPSPEPLKLSRILEDTESRIGAQPRSFAPSRFKPASEGSQKNPAEKFASGLSNEQFASILLSKLSVGKTGAQLRTQL